MKSLADLRFVVSLYKHLDVPLRRMVNGLLCLLALPIVVAVGWLWLGGDSKPATALDAPKLPVRSEPRPEYIPLPPTTVWPARGNITASFGSRTPAQRHHSGIDIGGHHGDPVTAFRAGTVIKVERSAYNSTGLGRYVVIDHGGGMTSVYGHLSSVLVSGGQIVNTQTVIGKEGSTGQAYGVHLHFEIRINGKPVNPRHHLSGIPTQ